ncbi:MAG TPA: structural protein MipA [Sulfurimonas sp. UBA12504]|nr:MAG: structural protein MipA [Sulfurimonas sp. GWF2_37_8]DAB29566.1 MAG TPA: structural protein MipA [Sulfurimonas sp. UBA12504]
MKYLLILLVFFAHIMAEDSKQKVTIGAGPYIQTQPYKGVDDILLPSPVIFFDNGLFYVRWSRAGVYFLGEKKEDYAWGFSLTIQPRTYGYAASEIVGMHTRENTFEGGVAFSAQKDKAYIELMALSDVMGRYDSWIFKTEAGYDFEYGKFSFYPSLIFIYQTAQFTNYYYGVETDEVNAQRAAYVPSEGLQIGAQTYIKYPLTNELSALINLRVDKLSQEAINSPLVDEEYIYSGLASLIYTFEY